MILQIKSNSVKFQGRNTTIMKSILSLTLARKIILKQILDFSINLINMIKLATREWNSIFMGEKQKVLEHIWNLVSFIYHLQRRLLSFQFLNVTEDFYRIIWNDCLQAQGIMRVKYKLLKQELKMEHLQCLEHQEMSLFLNMLLIIKSWSRRDCIEYY
jgi:hypothetical protein